MISLIHCTWNIMNLTLKEKRFLQKKFTITTDKKTNNDIRILYFIWKQVVQCPKKKCISFSRPIGYEYGSLFPCSCLIVFQLIDLLDCLYIQIYTTEMVLSLQSSVAGRFVFVKAVDKQCIYIFVFVHYLSVR